MYVYMHAREREREMDGWMYGLMNNERKNQFLINVNFFFVINCGEMRVVVLGPITTTM